MFACFAGIIALAIAVHGTESQKNAEYQNDDPNIGYAAIQEAPTNLLIWPITTGQMKLSWTEPKQWLANKVNDRKYRITMDENKVPFYNVDRNYNETNYFAIGLKPFTIYTIEVKATSTVNNKVVLSEPLTGEARTLIDVPGSPKDFKVTYFDSTSIRVKWSKPDLLNGPLTGYRIELYLIESNSYNSKYTNLPEEVTFSNLDNWKEYTINVTAYNEAKNGMIFGKPSRVIQKTDVGQPSPCKNIKIVKHIDSMSIVIEWSSPLIQNGPIDGYYLKYFYSDVNVTEVAKVTKEKVSATVVSLLPYTNYTFQVTAFNKFTSKGGVIESEKSEKVETKTDPGAPSAPEWQSTETTNNTIEIAWKKPIDPKGPISGYLLSCDLCDSEKNVEVNNLTHIFSELKSRTNYAITIKAFNMAVKSGTHKIIGAELAIKKTTLPSKPSKPENLTAISVEKNHIEIQWKEPKITDGPLAGYTATCFQDKEKMNVTELSASENKVKFSGLKPGTMYTLSVVAYNKNEDPFERIEGPSNTIQQATSGESCVRFSIVTLMVSLFMVPLLMWKS